MPALECLETRDALSGGFLSPGAIDGSAQIRLPSVAYLFAPQI